MTKANLQVKAFHALVTRKTLVSYARDDGYVYITFDGYSAFAVPEQDVCIDISKMYHLPSLRNLFSLGDDYVEAELTKRCAMFNTNGGILREYRARDDASKKVWVQESMMKRCQPEECWAYIRGELDAVKFVNVVTGKVDHIILPVRVAEEIKND